MRPAQPRYPGPPAGTALTEEPLLARDGGPQRDVLTFIVGGEEYALGIESIREIIKLRPITEVPRVPPFIAGVISVRGLVMPVIDLRLRLRLSVAPLGDKARILVVTRPPGPMDPLGEGGPQEPFGLIVDRVHHVVRLQEADIEPPPPTLLQGLEADFVSGIGRFQRSDGPEGRAGAKGGGPIAPPVPRRATGSGVLPRQQQMLILIDLVRVLTFEFGERAAALSGSPMMMAMAMATAREKQ